MALSRKLYNSRFWQDTFHGKKNATHNTQKDLSDRYKNVDKEILVPINFDHPLKNIENNKFIMIKVFVDNDCIYHSVTSEELKYFEENNWEKINIVLGTKELINIKYEICKNEKI
jgi:hypothetical protein